MVSFLLFMLNIIYCKLLTIDHQIRTKSMEEQIQERIERRNGKSNRVSISKKSLSAEAAYSCLPNKRGATAIYFERFFHATRSN